MNKGFEQLRVTAAYPNVNLKVVGTHSGISIGEDGPSQMSIEEIGLACSPARLRGALAGRRSGHARTGARRCRARRPGVHPRRPAQGARSSTSPIRNSKSARPSR